MGHPAITLVFAHGVLGWGDRSLRRGLSKDYFYGVRPFYRKEYGARFQLDMLTPTVSPADGIRERAYVFAAQVKDALQANPTTRVHIIAHSMGGLDARWAMAKEGLADRVASLTTIGTPHHGTSVATKLSPYVRVLHLGGRFLAWTYDRASGLWTDTRNGEPVDPWEFAHRVLDGFRVSEKQAKHATGDLSIESMKQFNDELTADEARILKQTNTPALFAYGGDLNDSLPEDRSQAALLRPAHALLKNWGTSEERTSPNDGMVSVWSAHFPSNLPGAHYIDTIPFAHFLQINWRFPDTRGNDELSDPLKDFYRDVMKNILSVA